MKIYGATIIGLCQAQSLFQGMSNIAGFLTGREPEQTFVNQVSQAGTDAVVDAAEHLRGNVQSRAILNSNLLRKNLELVNRGGNALKDIASQTYVGAGLLGATETIRSNLLRPTLPNFNLPSVFNGEGPMRLLVSSIFHGQEA